jgi:serine protease inhibitor
VGQPVQRVRYGAQSDLRYGVVDALGVQAVELPYREELSMLVVLPDAGRFDEVEAALATELLDRIHSGMSRETVALRLPKLELRFATVNAMSAYSPSVDSTIVIADNRSVKNPDQADVKRSMLETSESA